MRKQKHNEAVSNEAFTAHFRQHYGEPLPIWIATEVMSMGDLHRLVGGLTQRDRQQIAVDYDICGPDGNGDAAALTSWLEHLRQTRNSCAHHARIWNRNHTAPVSVPSGIPELDHLRGRIDERTGTRTLARAALRIYGSIVVIAYLLARVDVTNDARDRLRGLCERFADGDSERLRAMGFPDAWEEELIWKSDYGRDPRVAEISSLLRQVELLYSADAASLLTMKADHGERRSLLDYYRKRGAVLSVPGTEAHRYPSFQFDVHSGDVFPLAVRANRRLLGGRSGSEEERWKCLQWWMSPNRLLGGASPRAALESGALTPDIVDESLEPRHDE